MAGGRVTLATPRRRSGANALAIGLSAVILVAACQTAAPVTSPTPRDTVTSTPAQPTPEPQTATPVVTTPTAVVDSPSPLAATATPSAVVTGEPPTLAIEQQFCSLEQGRDTIRPLLEQLQQTVAARDYEGAKIPAAELANWSASWRSMLADPVASFGPTAPVAVAIGAALDILDVQLNRVLAYSPVMGVPPPSAEEVTVATGTFLAAMETIDVAIAAVPELACGVGLV